MKAIDVLAVAEQASSQKGNGARASMEASSSPCSVNYSRSGIFQLSDESGVRTFPGLPPRMRTMRGDSDKTWTSGKEGILVAILREAKLLRLLQGRDASCLTVKCLNMKR